MSFCQGERGLIWLEFQIIVQAISTQSGLGLRLAWVTETGIEVTLTTL